MLRWSRFGMLQPSNTSLEGNETLKLSLIFARLVNSGTVFRTTENTDYGVLSQAFKYLYIFIAH